MKAATVARPVVSGFCETENHKLCRGFFPAAGGCPAWNCACSHHLEVPPPAEGIPDFIPALRRITPTGFLICADEPGSPEWLAARAPLITATDIPQLLGLSRYGTARHVYERKIGNLPGDDAGEAARWGNLLEDVVAREWARREGKSVRRVGVVANVDRPWMGASCDRRVDGEPAAVEVKTRSAFVAGQWRDDMPDDVLAQVAWQRLVTGFDRIYVACLIGGQRLLSFTYERDVDVERYVLEHATALWQQIQDRTPPVVDPSALMLDLLHRLYPNRAGDRDLTAQRDLVASWHTAFTAAGATRLAAEKAEVAAKAALVELLGDGELALVDGDFAYAYPARTRTNKARPASVSTYRQLTFKQPKGEIAA